MHNPLYQAAKVSGGQITPIHGPNCATHRNAPCGCDLQFRIQRQPKRKGGRGR